MENNIIQDNSTTVSRAIGYLYKQHPNLTLRNNLCNFNTSTSSTSTGIQGISLTGATAAISGNQSQGHTTNFDFSTSGITVPFITFYTSTGVYNPSVLPLDNISTVP